MIEAALGSGVFPPNNNLFRGTRAELLQQLQGFQDVLKDGVKDARKAEALTSSLLANARNAENRAVQLQLQGLQNEFLVYKGLGEIGAKGLASVTKKSLSLAKATLSPLDYSSRQGQTNNTGLLKTSFLA